MSTAAVSLHPIVGLPLFQAGDDLVAQLAAAIDASTGMQDGDILVIAQKIVSKVEGRFVDLASVTPSQQAIEIASRTGKDPRHVEIVLSESDEVVKVGPHVVVVAHRLGFVMANAGVDESNIDHAGGEGRALLLPLDPDGTALEIKRALDERFGVRCGVIINDSFGRPWRNGVVGVALGAAGVPSLVNRIGHTDLYGRTLHVTEIATADEIASAASLLMGQADEGIPAVLVRGLRIAAPDVPASGLVRAKSRDMFR